MSREMIKAIGEPATWEHLASEAMELGHAALRIAQIMRGEDPTDVSFDHAMNDAIEEFTDLLNFTDEVGLKPSPRIAREKMDRFWRRVEWRRTTNE